MIDSHAHLTEDVLYNDIDGVIQRALGCGVTKIVNICTDSKTLVRGLGLAKRYPFIYNVASTTPHDAKDTPDVFFDAVAQAAKEGQLVAIGETGLEYFHCQETKKELIAYFKRYLDLAAQYSLPVVIHCREAYDDFFNIIDTHFKGRGLLHCFTGTKQEALMLIERGWSISFSGIVTFKNSVALQEIAKIIPSDRILIETDAPYLAPTPHRGKQNESSYLPYIAHYIANLRGIDAALFIAQTQENAQRFFNII